MGVRRANKRVTIRKEQQNLINRQPSAIEKAPSNQ